MTRLRRATIETELGTEVQCATCRQFWPLDREFWFFGTDGRPHSWCKACYYESNCFQRRRARWLVRQREQRAARRGDVVEAVDEVPWAPVAIEQLPVVRPGPWLPGIAAALPPGAAP